MRASVLSGALFGIDAYVLEFEEDIARGLPSFSFENPPFLTLFGGCASPQKGLWLMHAGWRNTPIRQCRESHESYPIHASKGIFQYELLRL